NPLDAVGGTDCRAFLYAGGIDQHSFHAGRSARPGVFRMLGGQGSVCEGDRPRSLLRPRPFRAAGLGRRTFTGSNVFSVSGKLRGMVAHAASAWTRICRRRRRRGDRLASPASAMVSRGVVEWQVTADQNQNTYGRSYWAISMLGSFKARSSSTT